MTIYAPVLAPRAVRAAAILLVGLQCTSCSDTQSPYPAAEAQGIDGAALAGVVATASEIEGMKWLLVARNGALVTEEYFNGQNPDSLTEVRSVTKSVTSALVGIAMREGFITGVDETLTDHFGAVTDDLDPVLGATTIEDLLTMRAGHDWQEIPGPSEFGDWVSAPDQVDYILAKPLVNPPGTLFNYSDGSAHLASVVISESTGMSALITTRIAMRVIGRIMRRLLISRRVIQCRPLSHRYKWQACF